VKRDGIEKNHSGLVIPNRRFVGRMYRQSDFLQPLDTFSQQVCTLIVREGSQGKTAGSESVQGQ